MIGPSGLRWIRDRLDRLFTGAAPRYCPRCRREADWQAETDMTEAGSITCTCSRCGMRLVVYASLDS